MLTFNTDITVFSHWKKGREEAWIRTHVPNASWHGGQVVTSGSNRRTAADKYTVRLRETSLIDYITPVEWMNLDGAPSAKWTLQAGDVIVRGFVDDVVDTGITHITNKYKACFVVAGVYDNRRIALKHLRVEGG